MKNYIYIGATLKNGVRQYQVFRERPAQLIAQLQAVYPLIGQLFVSVEYLSAAQADVKKIGTARYLAYQQTLEKNLNSSTLLAKLTAGSDVDEESGKARSVETSPPKGKARGV